MNAFNLLTYSLAVFFASPTYAQDVGFATSGQGRGDPTDGRQQAQIDALNARTQSVNSDGTIKLEDAGTCDPGNEGLVKYDAAEQQPVFCNGTDWQPMGGGGSSGTNFTTLADGTIIQWGTASYSDSGDFNVSVTFPKAFPNNVFAVVPTKWRTFASVLSTSIYLASPPTLSGATFRFDTNTNEVYSGDLYYIAIGN